MAAQTQRTMERLQAILQRAGANFSQVIKQLLYITDMEAHAAHGRAQEAPADHLLDLPHRLPRHRVPPFARSFDARSIYLDTITRRFYPAFSAIFLANRHFAYRMG